MHEALQQARAVYAHRYNSARFGLAAGSLIRGEGTVASDLDLVVVYADGGGESRRESFRDEGRRVEAFVETPSGLGTFLEKERETGVPALAGMLAEGVYVGGDEAAAADEKKIAEAFLAAGPRPLSTTEIDRRRYQLTALYDDAIDAGDPMERWAVLAALYEALADFHLRAGGGWSGRGKALPRALCAHDSEMATRFEDIFTAGGERGLHALFTAILSPFGGPLREGFTDPAPV